MNMALGAVYKLPLFMLRKSGTKTTLYLVTTVKDVTDEDEYIQLINVETGDVEEFLGEDDEPIYTSARQFTNGSTKINYQSATTAELSSLVRARNEGQYYTLTDKENKDMFRTIKKTLDEVISKRESK
jgi:hypothetical protein